MAEEVLLAISTFPDAETADRIAHTLITEKFAACANIIAVVHSIYRWKDKIETAGEAIVFFKTTLDQQATLQEMLRALHPYDVAEIIFIPVVTGLPDYLRWVIESCCELDCFKQSSFRARHGVSDRGKKLLRRWRWQ
jgi:periplasmic divalent cation tolerance protein